MTTIVTLSGTPVAASTIMNRAYRIVTQTSESPNVAETAQMLEALNGLLDAWRNERLMCYATQDEPLTLVNGQLSYTIGLGGDLNTNRPVRINSAYVLYQSITYPVVIYTQDQYAAIPYKTQPGAFPIALYYAADMDSGHLWPWPICNTTGAELHVITWTPMISFATAATTAALAPGWQDALTFALAVAISPEYQAPVTKDLATMAKNAKKGIKVANHVNPVSTFDHSLIAAPYWNWRTGV